MITLVYISSFFVQIWQRPSGTDMNLFVYALNLICIAYQMKLEKKSGDFVSHLDLFIYHVQGAGR